MKNRILLKEIPSNKFHAAIFTTYSINLYYLEQQVLPLLGSKGIHYISILADGAMLSTQLENYGHLSQQRKRNYSINGIQSNGAFHPKLIFLTGPDSILLLIGSGNLTTSGHGKNLEVWNSIYVTSPEDSKFGFVIQAWKYLKQLHEDLGESAIVKLKCIEENCSLLSESIDFKPNTIFYLDEESQISFLANSPNDSLFRQFSQIIGDDMIKSITIMSPYHDSEGLFIQEMNNRFNPKKINVLVQENFGSLPFNMAKSSNVNFYDWTEVMSEKISQSYFHAKNIILEGKNKNYLISGSANASIAAFGTLNIPALNQESCIIYQSKSKNYLDLLSIELKCKPVKLKDYESYSNFKTLESTSIASVFIKVAEKNLDTITLVIKAKRKVENGTLQFFNSKGFVQFEQNISLESGQHSYKYPIKYDTELMFAMISSKAYEISNRQFITDIIAFESTNPSPRNRSLNQIRKMIEGGEFSSLKIIDYLNTLYQQKEIKKGISKKTSQEENNDPLLEEENELLYLSYGQIQERVNQLNNQRMISNYTQYKGVRLWESIFTYLKDSREKELQSKIDEEETENINESTGRIEKKESRPQKSISISHFEKSKVKVKKFLDDYFNILFYKNINPLREQPTLIDLSMYLIMIEVLFHLVGYKESVENDAEKRHLISIPHSTKGMSLCNYLITYIGMFTMWCSKSGGFKHIDSPEYAIKLNQYKTMAFKTNLSALAIFRNVNPINETLNNWNITCLLNSNLIFNVDNKVYTDSEEFLSFIPKNILEEIGENVLEEDIFSNINDIEKFNIEKEDYHEGHFFKHPEIGFTYINKVIKNSQNTFYKLFSPGFYWDEKLENYWDGNLYSVIEKKWLKSKNH